ncbi:MAG: ATP-binding cassette domain-containing protein [Candidatus Poseidoniales archaeon]|jgi:phosphonate transport system ATP-binding protein|tara:strand:- start:740 stop:1399 length:660 start_codon:yes stop_codon:yes gene_type:complete
MPKELAKLDHLTVGYDKPLISDLTTTIKSGEIIAILGPSGIGKTTLIRTIAGLIAPLKGSVEVLVPKRGGLGYIPQRLGLVRHMSVKANVELGARCRTSIWYPAFAPLPKHLRNEVKEAIEKLGILEHLNDPVRILSGGQQRRVATARALAQKPQIILADEFLGELDDDNVEIVLRIVKQLVRQQGCALVMVEHHEEVARSIADRIWLIEDGKLKEGAP